ncbi:MAG: NADH-quinone oxidoreductase subunit L [Candidatus Thermoplasmatota archaeon]|nr:NADH-quinone oxidoreductase subunit L [Candidatus Thermoplasmatota archaeon]
MDGESAKITAIALTTLAPLLAGLLCYIAPGRKSRNVLISAGIVSAMAGSVLLFLLLRGSPGHTIRIELGSVAIPGLGAISANEIITIAEITLAAAFIYLAARIKAFYALALSIAQLGAMIWYEFSYAPAHGSEHAVRILIDYWSGTMCLIVSIIGSLIVIYAVKYMEGQHSQNRFFAYFVGFLGAMNAAVFCDSLAAFLLFWEITTLASYMLIKHEQNTESLQNAKRAFQLNVIGGAGISAAIIVLGIACNISSLGEIAALEGAIAPALMLGVILLCFGAIVKSAQVPFQSWLLGAMVAPTPVSALLHSSTMVKLGIYLIIRLSPAFSHFPAVGYMLALIGGFSFVSTAIIAISQNNAKKVLAYSTIGNLGLIIMLAGIHTSLAISAAIILTIFHAISKALLFMGVGVVQHEMHTRDIEDTEGMIAKRPLIATIILMGIVTMIIPPFGVFVGKYMAIQASVAAPWMMILLAVGSAATVVYYVKWFGRLISTDREMERKPEHMSTLFSTPLAALLAGAIGLSFVIVQVVAWFVDPAVASMGYDVVLQAISVEVVTPSGYISSIAIGASMAAVLLAGLMIKLDDSKKTRPYSCGIEFPGELGGMYMHGYAGEDKVNKYVNFAGIALIMIFVAIGIIAMAVGKVM